MNIENPGQVVEQLGQKFPKSGRASGLNNPMNDKNRELVTVVKKDGTVDMKLGSILTVGRYLTNKFNVENNIVD